MHENNHFGVFINIIVHLLLLLLLPLLPHLHIGYNLPFNLMFVNSSFEKFPS